MLDPTSSHATLSERIEDLHLIETALRRAVREALLRHKLAGNPVAVGRDGRVVWIAPKDIKIEPER